MNFKMFYVVLAFFAVMLSSVVQAAPVKAGQPLPVPAQIDTAVLLSNGNSGTQAQLQVYLRQAPADPNGFGLAIVFDSAEATFSHFNQLYPSGLFMASSDSEPDSQDIDNNPRTDRIVRATWLDFSSPWTAPAPGGQLVSAVFLTAPPEATATGFNIVSLSRDTRHGFNAQNQTIAPLSLPSAKRDQSAGGSSWSPDTKAVQHRKQTVSQELDSRSIQRPLPRASIFTPADNTPAACSLDIDGNGSTDALTDGILLVRYLFGFTGSSLTQGAVGNGASRTEPADILAYLESESCEDVLDIDGNGVGGALTDGIVTIRFLFGFTGEDLIRGAVAADATRNSAAEVTQWIEFYDILTAAVELSAPEIESALLSGITQSFSVPTRYSGQKLLRYHLLEGPDAMRIDTASGEIVWTPSASQEGTEVMVTVNATDGEAYAEVDFTVPVLQPTPVATDVQDSTVTVTESGSNLQGLSLSLPAQTRSVAGPQPRAVAPEEVQVGVIADDQAPAVPDHILRLTDFYRTSPLVGEDGLFTIQLPDLTLPQGRTAGELRLYVYAKVLDADQPIWIPVSYQLDIDDQGNVSVKLQAVGEVSFIGLPATAASSPQARRFAVGGLFSKRLKAISNDYDVTLSDGGQVSITCTYRTTPEHPTDGDPNQQICAVQDTGFQVTVKNFNDHQWQSGGSRWTGSIGQLVGWIYDARSAFDTLGLSYDDEFEVVIETIRETLGACYLGYVWSGENYDVLHLSDGAPSCGSISTATIQGTAVHEYFHHAQARTTLPNTSSLIAQPGSNKQWLTEGTARWFEDYLFDSLDTYKLKEADPAPQILKEGFAASHGNGAARGYARFAFWKLLQNRCVGFSLPEVLNGDFSSDPSGLTNLVTELETNWMCGFGDGLGTGNADELAAALLYYQYATVHSNNIGLLEADESGFDFSSNVFTFATPALGSNFSTFSRDSGQLSLKPAGVVSVKIPQLNLSGALPANKEFVLKVLPDTVTPLISIASSDSQVVPRAIVPGGDPSGWFDTAQQREFVYRPSSDTAAEMFITAVNPSSDTSGNVRFVWELRSTLLDELTVTGPQSGQSYDNRVIEVTGTIPDDLVGTVTQVRIDQPNFGGAENLATVTNNSFSGNAIIRLGTNSITVVGLDADGNELTLPTTVSFQGVESANPTDRNALVKSNLVFVLTWDTNATDIDQYVTDPLGRIIWYGNRSISGVGRQDFDDLSGFGPEVTTFFTEGAPAGNYEVDINFYSGVQETQVAVDVLLNEGSNSSAVGYRYVSPTPLTDPSFNFGPPAETDGPSWKTDVIQVNCTGTGVGQDCGLRF